MDSEHDVRVLSERESNNLWSRLQARWGVTPESYWFPLTNKSSPTDIVVFQADPFEDNVPILKGILVDYGINRLFELREHELVREVNVSELDPYYNGTEGFWTSNDMDWLIYASHENSITVAGDWLVTAIAAKWLGWQQHLYRENEGH